MDKCVCKHNTCGLECDKCCPMFNQEPWQQGSLECQECQCNNHADQCRYDPVVAANRLSINKEGVHQGGGVCIACRHNTKGINCEQCLDGYYRPRGVPVDARGACIQCQCSGPGMSGLCIQNEYGDGEPGQCLCKPGFQGADCGECAPGYMDPPFCRSCKCNAAGVVNDQEACDEGKGCACKKNVEGEQCDKCKVSDKFQRAPG